MSVDRPALERRAGIVPYPEGAVLPKTATDAFEDLIRFAGTLQPREEVKKLVGKLDPSRIILAAQGLPIHPPLDDFEHYAFYTLEYCLRNDLLRTPVQAIGTIVAVKQEVLNGGVFIGQERIARPILPPQ